MVTIESYVHLNVQSVVGSSEANLFLINLFLELEATAGRGTVSGYRFFHFEITKLSITLL